MGLRLNTAKSPGAYTRMVYPKGSYILHMLRWMMYDPKTGDQRFIAMMKDFVQTNFNKNVSTEGFQATVEKHMTPNMTWPVTNDELVLSPVGVWDGGPDVTGSTTPSHQGKTAALCSKARLRRATSHRTIAGCWFRFTLISTERSSGWVKRV